MDGGRQQGVKNRGKNIVTADLFVTFFSKQEVLCKVVSGRVQVCKCVTSRQVVVRNSQCYVTTRQVASQREMFCGRMRQFAGGWRCQVVVVECQPGSSCVEATPRPQVT